MTRRLLAIAVVGVLLTSGCLGFITGQQAATFESEPVSVAQSARSDAGYQEVRRDSFTRERTFSAAGESRTVAVTSHVAEYSRAAQLAVLSDQEVARFTVYSTPRVEVLNRSFNPVAGKSNRELARDLQQQYDSISDLQLQGNRTVSSLGEGRRVSKFTATAATESGQEVDVYLHVASFTVETDVVVVVAVYPRQLDGEQRKVDTLLNGIQRGG